jgi:hypothetical protein
VLAVGIVVPIETLEGPNLVEKRCLVGVRQGSNASVFVAETSMCFATALDKAYDNIDYMIAILGRQAKNCLYKSSQRLIQPRRVLCSSPPTKNCF